jgi:hypothetical protein
MRSVCETDEIIDLILAKPVRGRKATFADPRILDFRPFDEAQRNVVRLTAKTGGGYRRLDALIHEGI